MENGDGKIKGMEELEQLLDYLIELADGKEIEDIDYDPYNKEYEIKISSGVK